MAHRVVVVGGGAGGLELITALGWSKRLSRNPKISLTLLDGRPTHIWKPLLHEVATGSFNSGQDEINYFSHSAENSYKFILGWMGGLDRDKKVVKVDTLKVMKKVIAEKREIPYDTLVLALGSTPTTFKTPGARENCLFLNNPQDADAIRESLLIQGLSVLYGASGPKLRIGIVGAGATGVELAAEIHRTIDALKITGFRINNLETTVLEAGPRILAAGDEKLSQLASKILEKKGIEVKTNCKIKEVTNKGFVLDDPTSTLLAKDIRIWTAGIRSPYWLSDIGLKTNVQNRILTNTLLQSLNDPSIYAIGDCSCTPLKEGSETPSLPTTAQVAHQQAMWLSKYLEKKVLGKSTATVGQFKYRPQGFLVSLGSQTAVGTLKLLGILPDYQVKGYIAKGLYISLYRKHQMQVLGFPKTASLWIGDRFHYMAMPDLKFH